MAERNRTDVPASDEADAADGRRHEPTSMVVPKNANLTEPPSQVHTTPAGAVDPARFAYHLLRPGARNGLERDRWIHAYWCWRAVWEQSLQELDGSDTVFSDDFTRQHEVGCLFYDDRCVGLTGYRWVDLSLDAYRHDSYFKVWSRSVLDTAISGGSQICIGSNLMVLPTWRGFIHGYSVKEILMTMAVKRFLSSHADTMVGTMRNDRGMNGLVYRLGAKAVVQNVRHHGGQVDLVTFSRHAMGPITPAPAVDILTRALWKNAFAWRQHEERTG